MDRQGAVRQRLRQALRMRTLGSVFPPRPAREKDQQLSIWPITSRLAIGWCGLGQDFFLPREGRLPGDLRRVDRCLPEPPLPARATVR
jgi:hypothetical protein